MLPKTVPPLGAYTPTNSAFLEGRDAPDGPVRERIDVLDVLRGIALLGMFVVHFSYYTLYRSPAVPGTPPIGMSTLSHVIDWVFEGRFYTLFGMLFGVGFAIQLDRADARGDHFVVRYLRRMATLAVFGFIAEGIFGYNVLFGYALWGIPLLLVRRWSTRSLIVLLALCAASPQVWDLGRIALATARPGGVEQIAVADSARNARFAAARAALDSADESPSWRTIIAARMRFMVRFHRRWSTLPRGSFTLFLIGLIAFRLGLFDRPEQHRRLIVALMAGGAVSWIISTWVLPVGGPVAPLRSGHAPVLQAAITMARTNAFLLLRTDWLAFVYAGAVLLLVANNRAWLHRLAPFAWTGRVALTCYMLQVIFLDLTFSKRGLDVPLSPLAVPLWAAALFAVQALGARWWLQRYQFGPLEWVWRSATYWRVQPMRRVASA